VEMRNWEAFMGELADDGSVLRLMHRFRCA